MRDFDCHFSFVTEFETCGRSAEDAIENIQARIPKSLRELLMVFTTCDLEHYEDSFEAKELENGWYSVSMTWGSSWMIDAANEEEARNLAQKHLNDVLTGVYRSFENFADKCKLVSFVNLNNEQVTDVLAA